MSSKLDVVKKGVHIVVATPGRLKFLLLQKMMDLGNCMYLALDEADRLLDLPFEDDVREVLNHFKGQRQTLLFSATMPHNVKPVAVTVGRAGAVNLNVEQEVEYVKQNKKLESRRKCVEKTAGSIHTWRHGPKRERVQSHHSDQEKGMHWLQLATDVASKGLDFPDIKHVINYDMRSEIENYVHRIGRTGRRGKSGIATTLINGNESTTTLLDLKRLLQEARQSVLKLSAPVAAVHGGCAYCVGRGHRSLECPKQQRPLTAVAPSLRDCFLARGDIRQRSNCIFFSFNLK